MKRVIRSFLHKGLAELWRTGRSRRIDAALQPRLLRRLDRLDTAATLSALNVAGFDFHALKGFRPTRYTIHVNGPWCVTFEFAGGDVFRIDLEQYH